MQHRAEGTNYTGRIIPERYAVLWQRSLLSGKGEKGERKDCVRQGQATERHKYNMFALSSL